jgi:RimJ/RimL family protein N-acetyltransferase
VIHSEGLLLKKAEEKDVDLLFNWISDPVVRKQSLSAEKISYEDHVRWFLKKMNDSNCYLYIVYINDLPIGMIRFDVDAAKTTISYLLDKAQRGKGIGTTLVTTGVKRFLDERAFQGIIYAIVKISNLASIKIFQKLGFEKESADKNLIRFKKIFS